MPSSSSGYRLVYIVLALCLGLPVFGGASSWYTGHLDQETGMVVIVAIIVFSAFIGITRAMQLHDQTCPRCAERKALDL